jgi:predicted MPP superfamily phosphohydrolase
VPPAVLVHLSDIHFLSGSWGLAARNSSIRTELMHDLAHMRKDLGDATAVVVTGDIAFSGHPDQYEVAREWLGQVSHQVGATDASVLTVPGNHDVHWPAINPSARLARESLRECPMDLLTPSIDELIGDPTRPLLAALDNYNDFAVGYRCEVPVSGLPWEATLPLPAGYHLAVRGITTVFNSDGNDADGSLVVGRTQTSLPRDMPGAVHVVLAHHGPEDCRDRREIRDRLRHKAAALLSGHHHDQRIQRLNDCVEIIAGAVHPEEQAGWCPTYNWIRFDVDTDATGSSQLVIEVWPRVMRPEWNRFGSGAEGAEHLHEVIALPEIAATAEGASWCATTSRSTAMSETAATVSGEGRDGAPSAEPDGAAPRPQLIDEEGFVDHERRITRDLLDLSVPDQESVLVACGLLSDVDLQKDHLTMILTALGNAKDPETLERLADQIAQARRHSQGRPT